MVEQKRRNLLKIAAYSIPFLLLGNAETTQAQAFPWTREEVLFGPDAGFVKSHQGTPLLVWADSVLTHFNLEDAISPWNTMALGMGRNSLFQTTQDTDEADVLFIPDSKTKVVPYPNYTHPFSSCIIYSSPYIYTTMAMHELGHALGFVDFVRATTNIAGYVNPARCDMPNKPYSGVMAYCDTYRRNRWFGDDDRMLLRLVGLA